MLYTNDTSSRITMILFSLSAFLALLMSISTAFAVEIWLTERVAIVGDFIGLTLSHNPGIAFGVLLPPVLQEVLIGIALIIVCVLAWRSPRSSLPLIGYGLIVGGALSNIIDRMPDGVVTDFIQVGSFPIFNIADSCITIGVLFVLAANIIVSRSTYH